MKGQRPGPKAPRGAQLGETGQLFGWLLLEETRVRSNTRLKLAPPVLKGLERHHLDTAWAGRAAEAGQEVKGILDDALGQDSGRRWRRRGRRRGSGLCSGNLLQPGRNGVGGFHLDADDKVAVGGADLEDGALLAGADGAKEAEVGGGAGLDVAGGGQVDGGGRVFGQGDAGQEEDDDVGEWAGGRGQRVEEGRGRGRRGGLGDERLAGWDDAEEQAGHGFRRVGGTGSGCVNE